MPTMFPRWLVVKEGETPDEFDCYEDAEASAKDYAAECPGVQCAMYEVRCRVVAEVRKPKVIKV